jgi:phage-related minor tail protein
VFPFAKGVGLMGEAGPEAIMPLKRGKDGKLGVASSGGGGVVINVAVDATGSKVEGDQGKSGQMGRMIGNAVRVVLVQEMRPGGMLA